MDSAALCNLALQTIGTRTTVTAAELVAQSTNEAIQFNIAVQQTRDELLRMAQWQCAKGMANLVYITSLPGTNENQSTPSSPLLTGPNQPFPQNELQWTPGMPLPPWTYEYNYPVDCIQALWIVPAFSTGVGGVPIYPTNTFTGYAAVWGGPPIKFDVSQDQFYPVTAAAVASGGSGYKVGDTIWLAFGPVNDSPIGMPAQLLVSTVSGSAITGVTIIPTVYGEDTPQTGAYFAPQANPQLQGSTSGSGSGATFNLTYGALGQQRVILTNQEYSTLSYVRRVTDPNVMDSQFLKAWRHILSATLCMALTGDKGMANNLIAIANGVIEQARQRDGNEALTVNDVTPDWIRIRGVNYNAYWTGGSDYDWGSAGMWPGY